MTYASWLPEPYILILTGLGLLIALVAWLPLALKRLPLSLPIVCIALGAAIFSLPQVTLKPLPAAYPAVSERFTEFVVIMALLGAGLKLERLLARQSVVEGKSVSVRVDSGGRRIIKHTNYSP